MADGIAYLIEKNALEEAVVKYCVAIDKLNDLDFMMSNFTPDAVLDLTGLELPRFEGHAQIRDFYAQVFADMSHHMHILTNFRVAKLEGDAAQPVPAHVRRRCGARDPTGTQGRFPDGEQHRGRRGSTGFAHQETATGDCRPLVRAHTARLARCIRHARRRPRGAAGIDRQGCTITSRPSHCAARCATSA
ncbi:nuclear transport factor 2 family protein [Novosphingobium sp. PASSN1]|uniref:nuclear transport factor 2 family protein n=1 Tax=Novosphingobium sp. PASSN1 TaxID=2015561 RepID=UPI000BD09B83|nr:MAG: hypothetical protein CFE35_09230 [Novosphingobium sp. PASSN1]